MKYSLKCILLLGLITAISFSARAMAEGLRVPAADCETPPFASCSREEGCKLGDLIIRGNATEPQTNRKFFLDYPCDLQPGEKVNFILSIHGAGAIGNWQRHYFPAHDYKEKYRLVIATPTAATGSPLRMWIGSADDEYLQNIVNLVIDQFGKENIRSFWLVGHSQGGMTANRLVCTDFFKDKDDGWLSLSGGRIGAVEISKDFFSKRRNPPSFKKISGGTEAEPGRAATPTCDISFIFTTGELEITGLPDTSPWAEKYHCGARIRGQDIVDIEKGYVTGQRPGSSKGWGREARPGTSETFTYPNCDGGMVVADVVRLDKGHTEGLEPKVTEELIKMMIAAPCGRMNR